MALTIANTLVILLLAGAALSALISWSLWRSVDVWEEFVAGLVLGAALAGIVGLFIGAPALSMLLGSVIGGALGLIFHVLQM